MDIDLSNELVMDTSTPLKNGENITKRRLSFSDAMRPEDPSRFHLGRDRYVTSNTFNGVQYVHVRVHEIEGDKLIPTTVGIALTLHQWCEIVRCKNEVTQAIRESTGDYMKHIGSGKFVTLSTFGKYRNIHIRQYWVPENSTDPKPTKKGIALTVSEWETICEVFTKLPEIVTELNNTRPCWAHDDHSNQQAALECTKCNPWGWENGV
jgi:hypothetical protein